jgi:hypothetical protein
LDLPFEIGPTWNVYVALSAVAALPAALVVVNSWEKRAPIGNAYLAMLLPLGVLLYLRSRTVHLDLEGARQGFAIFGTFIEYGRIARVATETRSGKGATTEVLVVYERDSRKKIVIVTRSVDPAKLLQFVRILRERAPRLRDDVFFPV